MINRPTSSGHAKAQKLLDSLPRGSVVIDAEGFAYQEGGIHGTGMWYRAFDNGDPLSSWELAFRAPIREMVVKG